MASPQYNGASHRRMRDRLVLIPLKRYGFVTCVTCGKVCTKPSEADAGHDHVNGGYLGAQCVPCNRGDGGRNGARVTNSRRATTWDW